MDNKLTDNHRRTLSITAQTVDETIDKIEKLLNRVNHQRDTRRITESYTPEGRKSIIENLHSLRKLNVKMIRILDLEKQEIDERQIVGAALTRLWLILSDSFSHKMKGFGEMPEDVAEQVDRFIEPMLNIVNEIQEKR